MLRVFGKPSYKVPGKSGFDDQGNLRIRIETDAHCLFLESIREKRLGKALPFDANAARERAEFLVGKGFEPADAAHLAVGEATADFLVSCDDRLIRNANRQHLRIRVVTPLQLAV